MLDLELMSIQKELDAALNTIETMGEGYNAIASLENHIREDGKYIKSDHEAYRTDVMNASRLLGGGVGHIAALPENLGELSTEAFKARIKEVGRSIWRGIARAGTTLRGVLSRWLTKIIDMLSSSSSRPDILKKKLMKKIDKVERIMKDYQIEEGQYINGIDSDTVARLKAEYGVESIERLFFDDGTGRVMATKDVLRRAPAAFPSLKNEAFRLKFSYLTTNDVDLGVGESSKDVVAKLARLCDDSFVGDVVSHYKSIGGISTKEDLHKFISDVRGNVNKTTAGVVEHIIESKAGKIEAGASYKVSGTINSTSSLTVTLKDAGTHIFPTTTFEEGAPKKVPSLASNSVEDLFVCISSPAEMKAVADRASTAIARLMEEIDKVCDKSGEILETRTKRLTEIATDMESQYVRELIRENRNIVTSTQGWVSQFEAIVRFVTMADRTANSIMVALELDVDRIAE